MTNPPMEKSVLKNIRFNLRGSNLGNFEFLFISDRHQSGDG